MKTNLILISFLERIYKAKRSEDFKSLLTVQIELNRLDKENRLLRDMLKDKTELCIKMESKAHINESKSLKSISAISLLEEDNNRLQGVILKLTNTIPEAFDLENEISTLERENEALKEQVERLTNNIVI